MKFFLSCFLTSLLLVQGHAQTTYFQQDFSAGNPISQYISTAPGVGQFNGISGPSGSATITNGALHFDRQVDKTTGHFSRTTDLSPTPASLYIQFDFEVVSTTVTADNSCLFFYVGSAFGNGVGNPANSETYARFGLVFTGQGYSFAVRTIPAGGGGGNSATFTGKQKITFVLNNTGYPITYLQPGGGTKKLTDDHYDLWVGNNRVFSDQGVLTPTQTMTDFKLRIDDDVYAATFEFDNFLIRDIASTLPVTLTHFTGKAQGPQIDLAWTTTSEHNSDLFTVERSTDALEFGAIGSVTAAGETSAQRTYGFSDPAPAEGVNYYRLRQTDRDGSATLSKLVAVSYEPNQPALLLLNNPTTAADIRVRTYALATPTYHLATLTGQKTELATYPQPDGSTRLQPVGTLPVGVYLLTASTGALRLTRRLIVH